MDRRKVLSTSGAAAVAALAGCATGGAGSSSSAGSRTVFSVAQPMLPIVGTSEMFPVRRIYCIGRNYAAHAREMGSDPTREPPFFFQKPSDAIQFVAIGTIADHPYPPLTKNYHYEIELVAALGKGGQQHAVGAARSTHVYGYAVGLDMTRRDLQRAMGDEKKPWEIGKSFDRSAPIGPLHPRRARSAISPRARSRSRSTARSSRTPTSNQMIWNVAEQISKLSQAFELYAGRPDLQRHAGERRTGGRRAT